MRLMHCRTHAGRLQCEMTTVCTSNVHRTVSMLPARQARLPNPNSRDP